MLSAIAATLQSVPRLIGYAIAFAALSHYEDYDFGFRFLLLRLLAGLRFSSGAIAFSPYYAFRHAPADAFSIAHFDIFFASFHGAADAILIDFLAMLIFSSCHTPGVACQLCHYEMPADTAGGRRQLSLASLIFSSPFRCFSRRGVAMIFLRRHFHYFVDIRHITRSRFRR